MSTVHLFLLLLHLVSTMEPMMLLHQASESHLFVVEQHFGGQWPVLPAAVTHGITCGAVNVSWWMGLVLYTVGVLGIQGGIWAHPGCPHLLLMSIVAVENSINLCTAQAHGFQVGIQGIAVIAGFDGVLCHLLCNKLHQCTSCALIWVSGRLYICSVVISEAADV